MSVVGRAVPQQQRAGAEADQQHEEGEQVETAADESEDDHEAPYLAYVPALRAGDAFAVDAVGGDRGGGQDRR